MEVGPFRLKNENTLIANNGSWHEFANVLFIDQPVGTGYSYVASDSYVHDLEQATEQFLTFLHSFFQIFPHYLTDDLYISGESYAGQYIPYFADAILNREDTQHWNLRGILIGNGWIAPKSQYLSYLPFAQSVGLVKHNSLEKLQRKHNQCAAAINAQPEQDSINIQTCEDLANEIVVESKPDANTCFNYYDVRLTDRWPSCGMSWPPDLKYLNPYLRNADVVKAFNLDSEMKQGWRECDGNVGQGLNHQKSRASVELLPGILDRIPILLFSGDQDFICNHLGTEDMIHNMYWQNATGFEDPSHPGSWIPRQSWIFEGDHVGYYQEARNLTYVLFFNASHMVPYDYPRRVRNMFERFVEVDLKPIGGSAGNSVIGGNKTPINSVDESEAQSAEQHMNEIKEVKMGAYYRAGLAGIILVSIAGIIFIFYSYIHTGYFPWQRGGRPQGGYLWMLSGRKATEDSRNNRRNGTNVSPYARDDQDEYALEELVTGSPPPDMGANNNDIFRDSESE